jgi:hypothetical protein
MRSIKNCLLIVWLTAWLPCVAIAQSYDPPANYYSTAIGTGSTLKSQLHDIISTGDTPISYDDARTALQVTDADPANRGI